MAFFGRARDAAKRASAGVAIRVHLNARLQPMHRKERFEDPVLAALASNGMPSQVVDAGTLMSKEMRIESCDIAFAVPRDQADAALDVMKRAFRQLGTPRGSTITMYNELDPLGTLFGLVLRLPAIDTVDFTDESHVEHNRPVDALIDRCRVALGDEGGVWSWRVQHDTDVFVYGPSRTRLHELLAPQLATDPLLTDAELIDFA